jgi:hypothetical protein
VSLHSGLWSKFLLRVHRPGRERGQGRASPTELPTGTQNIPRGLCGCGQTEAERVGKFAWEGGNLEAKMGDWRGWGVTSKLRHGGE